MLDQVQRVQIRRIERDAFETDELVKRCLDILDTRGGRGRSRHGSSGSDGGEGDGIGVSGRRNLRSRSGRVRVPSRAWRAESATRGSFREFEEREAVRVRRQSGTQRRDGETSNTGRRRETTPGPRYEYEVIHPGGVAVVDNGRSERWEGTVVRRSVSRDRRRERYFDDRRASTAVRGSSRE